MASYYVWSGAGGGLANGTSWANAYVTLQAAIAGKLAGDIYYVAHDHTEVEAISHKILTFVGTVAAPNKVYCVDRAGSVPPVSANLRTGAVIRTAGALNLKLIGYVDFYGMTFMAGDTTTEANLYTCSANANVQRFVNCALQLGSTHTDAGIFTPDYNNGLCVLENTTVRFGGGPGSYQSVYISGQLIWRNTPAALTGSFIPDYILDLNAIGARAIIEGVDFSAATTGRYIYYPHDMGNTQLIMKDCRIGTGVAMPAGDITKYNNGDFQFFRCDSADTNYRTARINSLGAMTTETVIVHSGGATDGGTPVSWKIITSSICRWEFPFECLPISPITLFNETPGVARTVTIEGVWGGAAVPLNDEIWIDIEYLGTSGFPLATKATSTKANALVAGTALPAGSGTWGGSTTKFKMSATFTPLEKGPFAIYVRVAKPSSTFYIDPRPVVA